MAILSETLSFSSVENFLNPDQIKEVNLIVENIKQKSKVTFTAGKDVGSVHTISGYSLKETVKIYEPEGRIEISELPPIVYEIFRDSLKKYLKNIQKVFPSINSLDCLMYVEYGKGQFITPHIDYPHNLERPEDPKIAGLSIPLCNDFDGGEFFVKTTSSNDLWKDEDFIKSDLHSGLEWFRNIPKTTWTSKTSVGTALLFGTQLIHGTHPITRGTSKKIIGFFKK